jgi:hypothetical protein
MMNSVLNNLMQNPIQFVLQKGFNIPQNIGNDPNNIIQYLMNSGQISQEQYNRAVSMARQFKR